MMSVIFLRMARICADWAYRGLADLERALLGEADAEAPEHVAVDRLDIHRGLNERLPLADQGAELVGGEVHAPEVAQALLALDVLDAELDLAVGVVLVLVQVAERGLEDAALEAIRGELGSLGARDEGLADQRVGEHRWGLDLIPVLEGVGIDDLLLGSLLSLGETLVLANSHCRELL